jgi:hypothetical protein
MGHGGGPGFLPGRIEGDHEQGRQKEEDEADGTM